MGHPMVNLKNCYTDGRPNTRTKDNISYVYCFVRMIRLDSRIRISILYEYVSTYVPDMYDPSRISTKFSKCMSREGSALVPVCSTVRRLPSPCSLPHFVSFVQVNPAPACTTAVRHLQNWTPLLVVRTGGRHLIDGHPCPLESWTGADSTRRTNTHAVLWIPCSFPGSGDGRWLQVRIEDGGSGRSAVGE